MAVLQLQWQWWINWGGEAAELTYQLHIGSPVLPRLQGLRSALIPLSLHSPTDPRQGPRDTRPGEHPLKLFSETQALKTGVVPRCLAEAPIYCPARKACWVVWSWGVSKSKLGGECWLCRFLRSVSGTNYSSFQKALRKFHWKSGGEDYLGWEWKRDLPVLVSVSGLW